MLWPIIIYAQELNITKVTDWNSLKKSGFFESNVNSTNKPGNDDWYWGINIGHSNNSKTTTNDYNFNGQILIPVNSGMNIPQLYFRSTNRLGEGRWAKILHNLGDQSINGNLRVSQNIVIPRGVEISNSLSDNFIHSNLSMGHYAIKWISDPWQIGSGSLWISGHAGIKLFTGGQSRIAIKMNGNVGIGTTNPDALLTVAGLVKAREVKIEVTAGADHVFNSDYDLKPLSEVETFVKENKHLPEIPSERQMQEEGLSVNEFQIKLLQKIEELTLYVIDLKKENQVMKEENLEMRKEIDILKNN